MSTAGEVIFISGAARGIGRSIAETLARDGCRLALAEVTFDEVGAVAAALATEGATARAYRLDVRSPADISAVLEAVAADLGEPLGLVNNAGIYPDTPALEVARRTGTACSTSTSRAASSPARPSRAVARRSAGAGPSSSTSAFSARIGAVPYAASKAGNQGPRPRIPVACCSVSSLISVNT